MPRKGASAGTRNGGQSGARAGELITSNCGTQAGRLGQDLASLADGGDLSTVQKLAGHANNADRNTL